MEMWLNYDKNSVLFSFLCSVPSRVGQRASWWWTSCAARGVAGGADGVSGADGVRLGGLDEPYGATVR